MDILEMTNLELYEVGIKELTEQLGPAYTAKFLQQCKPSNYDYTAERHKLLEDQPSIDKIVERIHRREVERKEEERIKTERIAAWRKGLLELTNIEIYELGLKILADKLHVYGYVGFLQQHFKHLNSDQLVDKPQPQSDNDVSLAQAEQILTTEPHD
ncbi:hypothetical protein F4054_22655 [Candidatus Poribacteria bacterium]|nr:hypothetical protein [Candidatus Poribacteria bacterium]MYG08195.1 hypothetical protein [Candidatus Poribacteria bacterium]MYK25053.1 hypothetical protein [Candidatus Poribacteria bacterium]